MLSPVGWCNVFSPYSFMPWNLCAQQGTDQLTGQLWPDRWLAYQLHDTRLGDEISVYDSITQGHCVCRPTCGGSSRLSDAGLSGG